MTDKQIKCLDCKQTGHPWWECKDPKVVANRQIYWPTRKTNLDSFDYHADELKFEANDRDIFE